MLATFSFLKEFSTDDSSTYFLNDSDGFREVSAETVVNHDGLLITHDYWMICQELYDITGRLPSKVVDLDEYIILVSKHPESRGDREKFDSIEYINRFLPEHHAVAANYKNIFYGEIDPKASVVGKFHELMIIYYIELCRLAIARGEFDRYMSVEVDVQYICAMISAKGIKIDSSKIGEFRKDVDHFYYKGLKELSDNFDVPLEIPSDKEMEQYAVSKGVEIDQYGIKFIVNYLPHVRKYAESVLQLRELSNSRNVLNSMAVKDNRVHPIVDSQGSRTSRIMVRSPFLQSLAKKYRSLLIPDSGKNICYVDYDQFEVGIMAALSEDQNLLALYAQTDMYETFREIQLSGEGERKGAKTLFLAYAYGMKRSHLPVVGSNFGISKSSIKNAFKQFGKYESWKTQVIDNLNSSSYVSTSNGNRYYIKGKIATKKEKLSAISQVVQGEGALIFKKALIKVSKIEDVEIMLPMHDAVLFQYTEQQTPQLVRKTFEDELTKHFHNKISGKASIEEFYNSE